jgi:pSer/pThr/pTyr-binding forkhead associated (FHA) protein
MKCTLVVINALTGATSWEFEQERITIGRTPDNDLVLDEISVSRNHAEIVRKGRLFEVVDLGSKNGIEVNGQQTTKAILNNGDKIKVGNVTVEFKSDSPVTQPADESATMIAEDDQTVIFGGETEIFQAPKLVVTSGKDTGKEYVINKAVLTIGRLKENDIIINNSFVSRHHARILLHDGIVTIKDLDSGNGTFVNEKKIDQTILKSGDKIKIGEESFSFLEHGEVLSVEKVKKTIPISLPKLTQVPYPALLVVSLFVILFIGTILIVGEKDKTAVEQQDSGRKDLELYTQGQADMVSIIKEIQKSSGSVEQPAPSQHDTKSSGPLQKAETLNNSQQLNVQSISNALTLYTQGFADQAITMLKDINKDLDDRELSAQADSYISSIERVKESFLKGNVLYEEDLSESAFAEWKKTLIFEKALPLGNERSWYAKKIAQAAADKLYEKGLASYEKGNKDAAVKSWKKAIEIDPNHKEALSRLTDMAGKL